jgi:hypothetical protein
MSQSAAPIRFFDDTTADLTGLPGRKQVPILAPIPQDVQTVRTDPIGLAYLILQVIKTYNKMTVMRAIASGVATILEEASNFTGSTMPPVTLDEIEVPTDANRDKVIRTNFAEAEDCTYGELAPLLACDPDELAAWFGVMCYAGIKKPTPDNRTAYNEGRANLVKSTIIGDPVIFVPSSVYITDAILQKVNASFTSMGAVRAHLIQKTAEQMGRVTIGPKTTFSAIFLLIENHGTGALKIIKEAVIRYPWVRTDFPELKPDLAAAEAAQKIIRTVPASHRSFAKSIYGNTFVPIAQSEMTGLLGVCKNIMARTTTTYANFGGGSLTERQQQHIENKLSGIVETPEESA